MKLIGSFLVVGSGLILGLRMASYWKQKLCELQQWIGLLKMLVAELEFMRRPLPEVFSELAEKKDKVYAPFFACCVEGMQYNSRDFKPVWKQAISRYRETTRLGEEGLTLLVDLGRILGQCDWETQKTALQLLIKKLEDLEAMVSSQVKDKTRLWRYLGLLGSLAMVILLY